MKLRSSLAVFGSTLFACVSPLVGQTQQSQQPTEPKRPYTISKETTYFTGPLKPDGSINFVAAVNEHFSKGVTPGNNAARVIAPLIPLNRWDSIEQRDKVLIAIGLDPQDHTGDRALKTSITKQPEEYDEERYSNEWQTALDRLWKDDELFLITQWLSENEAALGAISVAAKQKRYYVPLLGEHDTGLIMTAPLNDAQAMRFVGAAFVVRANNHIAQQRWDAAWADILTIQELSRLVGQGQSSIQSIISTALSDLAAEAAKRFINGADEKIDWTALIDSWPTDVPTNFRDQIDIFERAMFIQVVCQIYDDPERSFMGGNSNQSETEKLIGKLGVNTLREMMESKAIDVDGVFRVANPLYDQAVTVFETEDYSKRFKLAESLEDKTYFYEELIEFYWRRNLQSWTRDSTIPFC